KSPRSGTGPWHPASKWVRSPPMGSPSQDGDVGSRPVSLRSERLGNVWQPPVHADGHSVSLRKGDGSFHVDWIAGMKSTRDVGGGQEGHYLGIGTEGIVTVAFADIAVDIDR